MCQSTQLHEVLVVQGLTPAFTAYKLNVGEYPSTEEGLDALRKAPEGKEHLWKGPYIEKDAIDPWGNPYQYRYPPTHKNVNYDLYTFGSDGIESKDDFGNWMSYSRCDFYLVHNIHAIALLAIGALLLAFTGLAIRRHF